ncbi:MAG TPA: ABC transporter permease subunit [Pseudomonadales bacterium]|nr:ABC transporter permease subunit [Pseudomonadales bacterium]
MNAVLGALLRRELASYFATPVAWVFVIIFLVLSGVCTFYVGGFFERGQADLLPFFDFHPWLHLILVSAIAMRLWADERRTGTLELLLTLPVRLRDAVVAKFLAGWIVIGAALALTFPIWWTVNYLGDPDNGVIAASYLGSWLLAGAFLAIGGCMSAAAGSQVVAFILTASLCFLYVMLGAPFLLEAFDGWLPPLLIRTIGALGALGHYEALSRGLLEFRDLAYFAVTIAGWLLATCIVIELRKVG